MSLTLSFSLTLQVPVSTLQAAVRIQRGWRRHAGKKIYRFFRDMIYFRERGDPAQVCPPWAV